VPRPPLASRDGVAAISNGVFGPNRRLALLVEDVRAIRRSLEDEGEEGAAEDQDR
jgi:hypothetical protein